MNMRNKNDATSGYSPINCMCIGKCAFMYLFWGSPSKESK